MTTKEPFCRVTEADRKELVRWLVDEYGFTKANAIDHVYHHYPRNYPPKKDKK